MADGKVTITVDLDGTSAQQGVKSLKSLLQGLGDTSSLGFGKGSKSALGFGAITGVASALVQKGMQMVNNSVGGAIDRFDTLKKYPVVMNALGYSAKDVAKSTKLLSDGIDGLPTTLSDITKSAQVFAPLTGSATSAAKSAVALNNAFLASGASLSDTSRGMQQYTQMLSTGKVDMMSWRTLMETMPVALDKVAKSFGFTGKSAKTDLFEALKNGEITIDDLNKKFVELNEGQNGFAELAKKNSAGIGTSFANLKNAVIKNLANMIEAIDNGFAKAGLGSIAKVIDSLKGAINSTFETITPIITDFVANAIKAAKKMWDSFKDTGAISAISNAFAHIKDAAEHVWDSLTKGKEIDFGELGSKIGEIAKWLAEAATKASNFISNLPPGTIQSIAGAVLGMVGAFKTVSTATKAIKGLKNSFDLLKTALSNPWGLAIAGIGMLIGWFIQAYTTSETFRNKVNEVAKVIGEVASKIAEFVSGLDPSMFTLIIPALTMLISKFKSFSSLSSLNPFKLFKKNATDAFTGAGKSATQSKGIIEQVFSGLGTLITSIAQGISTVLQGLATAISTVAQGFGQAAAMASPTQWLSMGAAMLMVGAGVALAASGIYILVQAAIQLASAGTGAQIAMLALGVGIAALAGIFALLGPALTASAVGILAFGASVALIGAGIAIAAVGLSVLVNAFANAQGAITATGQAISTAAQGIGQGIQSALSGAAQVVQSFGTAIKSALDGVANVFRSVGDSVKSAFEGIGNVIKSVGSSIKSVLDGISGVIESIGKAALNAGKGFDKLADGVVKITNTKLGDMAASLAAVAKGVGKISAHSEGLSQAGSGMKNLGTGMRTVSTAASTAVSGLTMFDSKINSLKTVVMSLPQMLTTAASGFSRFTSQAVSGVAGLSAINAPIATFKSQIMTITPALMMAGVSFASFGSKAMVISSAFATVGGLITAFNARVMTISTTMTMASTSFAMLGSRILAVGTALMTVSTSFMQVSSSATNASSQVRNMATSTQAVISAFNAMRGQVQSSMQAILAVIRSVGSQMKSQGRQIGQQTAQNIAQGIRGGIGQSTGAMHSLMGAVRSAGMSGVGSMRGIGAMIGQGLAAGMMSALGAVTAAANALVAQAERAARAKAQIHSPSRLFRDSVGRYLPMGVAVGIEKNTKYVDKAMGGMYDNIQAFSYKAEDIIGVGKTKLSKVVQVKSDFENAIKTKVEVAKEKGNDLMKKALDIAEKAVERPSELILDDGTLVAKTGDKYDQYQTEQTRRKNRMRGIVT